MAVIVAHSTEGSTLEGAVATLRARNSASHEVWEIGGERVQLVALDQPARALLNLPGGVETNNRGGVIQVEIVGFASRSSAAQALRVDEDHVPAGTPIIAELDDDQLSWLGHALRDLCAQVGAPFVFPRPFLPYPASYGDNGARLTFDEWLTVEGVIGHQHVPENDHGDPGALDVARMVALTTPALTPEDLMACLDPTTPITVSGRQYNAADVIAWTLEGVNALREAITRGDLTPTGPAGITAAQVADEFAKRLKA